MWFGLRMFVSYWLEIIIKKGDILILETIFELEIFFEFFKYKKYISNSEKLSYNFKRTKN